MRELGPRQEISYPKETISNEELGNLISAVGNHEAKALTLAAMRPGIIYTRMDLFRRFKEVQGVYQPWIPTNDIPFSYCQNSLSPIGLVTEEIIDPDLRTYGYVISDYGESIGIPFAGLMLSFSERHPGISLIRLFGRTSSPSKMSEVTKGEEVIEYRKRAPIVRLKIFQALVSANTPLTTGQLTTLVGEPGITSHVQSLASHGIINYESAPTDTRFSNYRLSETRPQLEPAVALYKSLTREVYNFFLGNPSGRYHPQDIAEFLLAHGQSRKPTTIRNLTAKITGVIATLAREGYLETDKFGHRLKSEITLSSEQRNLITDLVMTVRRFQGQDQQILEQGRQASSAIIVNPKRVAPLLEKAKEASAQANQRHTEEHAADILSIVQAFPNSSTKQIQQHLASERGIELSPSRVWLILKKLREKGLVITCAEKNACYWSLPFCQSLLSGK